MKEQVNKNEVLSTNEIDQKMIKSFFDNIPGGIVMYEWDGVDLKAIYVSEYYSKHYTLSKDNKETNKYQTRSQYIHPEDLEDYKKLVFKSLKETKQFEHVFRVWSDIKQRYLWIKVDAIAKPQGNGKAYIYAMYSDITKQEEAEKAMIKKYEIQLKSLLEANVNSISSRIVNLTSNTFDHVRLSPVANYINTSTNNYDDYIANIQRLIIGKNDEFINTFNRQSLLKMAKEDNMHATLEYLIKLENNHYEWITTYIDMVQNPTTNEVLGVLYSKSSQLSHFSNLLLEKTLKQDYIFAAIIFKDTDEFYLYNSSEGKFSERMANFWYAAINVPYTNTDQQTLDDLKKIFNKEKIVNHLQNENEFIYIYNSNFIRNDSRLEIKFSYLDEDKTMILASLRNITDASLLKRYRHDSEHDSLTDLYNRKKFIEQSRWLLQQYPNTPFAIVHLDVKHFHRFNTFFGEDNGDKLLCDLANILRTVNQDYPFSVYGRIEGDVFCELIPFDIKLCEQHIKNGIDLMQRYYQDFSVEPKIGIYLVNDHNMPIESMFTRASMAAKTIKVDSPNSFAFYNELVEQKLFEEQQVVNEMQTAIDEEQFKVYLQAKYALRTNKPVGAEALVRWIHPVKGVISPYKFIPVYESNGSIITLDRYMWEHVCQLLSKWKKEGRNLLPISVNMSRLSLFNNTTVSFLKELVTKYDVEPKYLELELTESAYVENTEIIKPRLIELQKFGFKILMDDFGSGYSSLNTLKDLPVDVLKLDMKLLSKSDENERGNMVVSSVVHLSKLLNLSVIAEGVEISEQANFLRNIGCEYVQGYLYARPVPVIEYERFVLSNLDSMKIEEAKEKTLFASLLYSKDATNRILGDEFPIPVAIIKWSNDDFFYLRTNYLFMQEFGLIDDLSSASNSFKHHLSAIEYDKLIKVYSKCAETKKEVAHKMIWANKDKQIEYIVNLAYKGSMGKYSIIMVTFTNISNIDL